jgi:hypothetical protein
MIDITLGICHRFGISLKNGCQIFVDGANPEFIRSLKRQLGENPDYEQEIDRIKKDFPGCDHEQNMLVVPVHFAKEHGQMLAHTKKLMEYNEGMVADDDYDVDTFGDEYLEAHGAEIKETQTYFPESGRTIVRKK